MLNFHDQVVQIIRQMIQGDGRGRGWPVAVQILNRPLSRSGENYVSAVSRNGRWSIGGSARTTRRGDRGR
jgi:hypothetical protein